MSTNSPWKAALADSTMLRRPQAFHQAVVPKMVFWSKKVVSVSAVTMPSQQVLAFLSVWTRRELLFLRFPAGQPVPCRKSPAAIRLPVRALT